MLKNILKLFGLLTIIAAIFPYLPLDHWSVRIFDFPQMQLALLTLIALFTYHIKFDFSNWRDYVFVSVLAFCFAVQAYKVVPYTAFASFTLNDATEGSKSTISLYNANVLQKNEDHNLLIKDIRRFNPEIVLLHETNSRWEKAVSAELAADYPHSLKAPQDNTYGMLLYSKLPLAKEEIHYMVEDTIPSIHAIVTNLAGDRFQLIGIHPTPPVPTQAESSADRDAEMMLAAQKARNTDIPVVVMGDFNDVAWSETTELFRKVSMLLDPRNGRGLYNTFNAHNWITRWPLDHIFVSADFRLKEIARGEKFGSDHFPYYVELSYEPEKASKQKPIKPTEEELREAFEQLDNEKRENYEQEKGVKDPF